MLYLPVSVVANPLRLQSHSVQASRTAAPAATQRQLIAPLCCEPRGVPASDDRSWGTPRPMCPGLVPPTAPPAQQPHGDYCQVHADVRTAEPRVKACRWLERLQRRNESQAGHAARRERRRTEIWLERSSTTSDMPGMPEADAHFRLTMPVLLSYSHTSPLCTCAACHSRVARCAPDCQEAARSCALLRVSGTCQQQY